MPQKIHKRQIGAFMKRRLNTSTREMKGITPTEAEETFRKEFGGYIKKVAEGPEKFSIPKTVEQFRKNNRELAEYFEPGKSKGFNKGKRDALLEYNRAIEEFYDTAYPNSEFSKLFKDQNQKWGQLKDFEFVEEQIGKIFEGEKINFKDITKILDKGNANYRRSFQRIMGKEGFKDFEGLVEDFISVKQPYSLLKRAEAAGFGDLAKLAGKFLINPTFGKLSAGKQIAEDAMKMLLDKPQFTIVWKQAMDNLKKGNYAEAEKGFNRLNEEAKATAEKVMPLAEKAKTLPEGFSPEFPEKVFDVNPNFQFPPPEYFKKIGLNEPVELIHAGQTRTMPNKFNQVTYKNSWPTLMNPKEFNNYYDFAKGGGQGEIGTAGELIKSPKIKNIYKDVLDMPIIVKPLPAGNFGGYSPSRKVITVNQNLAPQELYSTIIHELHHALQDKKLRLDRFGSSAKLRDVDYLRHPIEVKARLAQRYATKEIQKYRKTLQKLKESQEKKK